MLFFFFSFNFCMCFCSYLSFLWFHRERWRVLVSFCDSSVHVSCFSIRQKIKYWNKFTDKRHVRKKTRTDDFKNDFFLTSDDLFCQKNIGGLKLFADVNAFLKQVNSKFLQLKTQPLWILFFCANFAINKLHLHIFPATSAYCYAHCSQSKPGHMITLLQLGTIFVDSQWNKS